MSHLCGGTVGLFLDIYGHSCWTQRAAVLVSTRTWNKESKKKMFCRYFEPKKTFGLPWGYTKSVALGAIFDWYLFLLLGVGTQGNISGAISVALYCIEAKNLCVLISLTYHCTDRDRKSTQQIQCVDLLLTCIKGSKEDVISVFYYTPISTQSDCN